MNNHKNDNKDFILTFMFMMLLLSMLIYGKNEVDRRYKESRFNYINKELPRNK